MMNLGQYSIEVRSLKMEAYREYIAGAKLAEVMSLPEELKESELEVIILPIKKEGKQIEEIQTIDPDDLPRHKMGTECWPIDREHIYADER